MINISIIVGRLGKDPELRYSQGGLAICKFSVATSEKKKVQDEWVESTEWHNVVTFGKTAEACNEYLSKGKLVFVQGRSETSKYQKDGEEKRFTQLVAGKVKFLEPRSSEGSSQGSSNVEFHSGAPKFDSSQAQGLGESVSFDDDDIPF